MSEKKMSEELEFIQKREPRRFRDINNGERDVHEKGEAWVTCPSVTLGAYENLFKSTARKHNAFLDAREKVEARDKTIAALNESRCVANPPSGGCEWAKRDTEYKERIKKLEADLESERVNIVIVQRQRDDATRKFDEENEETEPQAPDGQPSKEDLEKRAESAESQRDKVRLLLSTARRLATESAAAVLDEFSTPYLSGGSLMLTNGKGPAYTPSGLAAMIRNNGEQKEDQPPKEEFLMAERVFTWMGHSANTLMCRQERHRLYPE